MPYLLTIPLSEKYRKEGTIQLHFNDEADLKREGYFSTTLYYKSKEPFTDTDYYHGINIYAQLINSPNKFEADDEPFFANVGFIIYTDRFSFPLLNRHFGNIPKIILAVVSWPRFAIDKRAIDGTILRTLRYQAQDHFKDAWIAVRDADTIFAYEINNCRLMKGRGGKIVPRPNAAELLANLVPMITTWERKFINQWIGSRKRIVISTSDSYRAEWHKYMPFTYAPKPYPTSTPPNNSEEEREAFLYVKQREHITKLLELEERKNPMATIFNAPLGVYAGFTNIAANAPGDLWTLCCKYLARFYKMLEDTEGTHKRIISNTYSSIGAIGKDERMILFALMPKYLNKMYFMHLDYYGGLDIGQAILGPGRLSTPALGYSHIHTSTSTPIHPVQTLLLAPNYVDLVYRLPYVEETGNPDRYELDKYGTMHEHFKDKFSRMVSLYRGFEKEIETFGTTLFDEFGAQYTREGKVLIPSLHETAYEPIRLVKGRVLVKTKRTVESPPTSAAATRRLEKSKSLAKKTRRRKTSSKSPSPSPEKIEDESP